MKGYPRLTLRYLGGRHSPIPTAQGALGRRGGVLYRHYLISSFWKILKFREGKCFPKAAQQDILYHALALFSFVLW
jgi:hypothetical protein